jgi:hypothetical protein
MNSNVPKTMGERFNAMTPTEVAFFKASHALLSEIKESPERYVEEGVSPVQLIKDLEFALQGVWKFTRDIGFHNHWLEIKGCACPKLDNMDGLFMGRGKIISGNCPWHGKKEE